MAPLSAGGVPPLSARGRPVPEEGLPLMARRFDELANETETVSGVLVEDLTETFMSCRDMLGFFGQRSAHFQAGDNVLAQRQFAEQAQSFLCDIDKFLAMLKAAFRDVSKHCNGCRRMGLPNPFAARGSAQDELQSLGFSTGSPVRKRSKCGSALSSKTLEDKARSEARAFVGELVEKCIRRVMAHDVAVDAVGTTVTEERPKEAEPRCDAPEVSSSAWPGQTHCLTLSRLAEDGGA